MDSASIVAIRLELLNVIGTVYSILQDPGYQDLLPQSPVFTLGFTGIEPLPGGAPDLPPHFSAQVKP